MKIFCLFLLLLGGIMSCRAQSADPRSYTFPQATIDTKVRAIFDSATAFVDGRLLDRDTHKPIANADVMMSFGPAQKREKAVRTNETGYFRLGWVGTVSGRRLTIHAAGYELLETDKVVVGPGVHTGFTIRLAATGQQLLKTASQ